ncbi:MAG: tetratricopeptide repeat protein [Muribaculaceae bacterium]
MKSKIYLFIIIALLPVIVFANENANTTVNSTKKERNYVRKGNKLYNEKRFAEAEVEYKKAIQENVNSEIAQFNLAASLIRQTGSADPNSKNNPGQVATDILNNLTKTVKDANLLSKAYYNLGNLSFLAEKYDQSIAMYKNSLRKNPNDDRARENLRIAQKKLKEQKKDDKKDDKKDKDKDKDKKEQDKDKQDKNKDKDKKDQKDNQQNKPENKDKQQQQQQGGMSQENIDQILKTMQDEEKGIQQKINAMKMKEQENNKRRTGNQW